MTDTMRRTDWAAADRNDDQPTTRRLIGDYLIAREAWEDETGTAQAFLVARELAVTALVADEYYTDANTAREELDALRAGMAGEFFVERWADREGLLTSLGSREITGMADMVRDWVAAGSCLDQLPMWDIAEPYLNPAEYGEDGFTPVNEKEPF